MKLGRQLKGAAELLLKSGCGNFEPEKFGPKDLIVPGKKVSGVYTGQANIMGDESIISVPEGTVAIVLDHQGIEQCFKEPGENIYFGNQRSTKDALRYLRLYDGACTTDKRLVYVNMKEIPNIKFGLPNAAPYYDHTYGVDLEIYAYGSFTIQVTDPEKVVRSFTCNASGRVNLADVDIHQQIIAEFNNIFLQTLSKISASERISHLQIERNQMIEDILEINAQANGFEKRFGFRIVSVAIESVIYSDKSKELINKYNEICMEMNAYAKVSEATSKIAAEQKVAEGIRNHGFYVPQGCYMGGMPANVTNNPVRDADSFAISKEVVEQMKLYKELYEAGIINNSEFLAKKKELLRL